MSIEDAYLHYVDDTKRKWKELTLDEALGIGLTKWDKQVPDDLANVDLCVSVRVDSEIYDYIGLVVKEYNWLSKGDVCKVITKHGMSIVSDKLDKIGTLKYIYVKIIDTISEGDVDLAERLILNSNTEFFLREKMVYSRKINIRPVWWVYTGADRISLLSNISKSDLIRCCIVYSMATKFNTFKRRREYYSACIDEQIFNITNAVTLACSRAGELTEDVKKKILHILDEYKDEYNMDLYKKLL